MIGGVHLHAHRGVMYRQMRPELLPNPVRRLRPKDLLTGELDTLDLLQETLDVPPFMVEDGEIFRGCPPWIHDRGHQSIQLIRAGKSVLDNTQPEGSPATLSRRDHLGDVGTIGQ